jgi:hypothetical protein
MVAETLVFSIDRYLDLKDLGNRVGAGNEVALRFFV